MVLCFFKALSIVCFAYTVPSDTLVYITPTGGKYHRQGCTYLYENTNSISIRAAEQKGYEACSRCNPDILTGNYDEESCYTIVKIENTQSDIRQRLKEIAEGTSSESAEAAHTQSSVRQRLRALAEGGGSTEPADPAFQRAAESNSENKPAVEPIFKKNYIKAEFYYGVLLGLIPGFLALVIILVFKKKGKVIVQMKRLLYFFAQKLGYAILFIIQLLLLGLIFVPLQYLGFPWWADALIALGVSLLPMIGGLATIAIWIWSFVIFIQSPFDTYGIVYIVALVFYIAFYICNRSWIARKQRR